MLFVFALLTAAAGSSNGGEHRHAGHGRQAPASAPASVLMPDPDAVPPEFAAEARTAAADHMDRGTRMFEAGNYAAAAKAWEAADALYQQAATPQGCVRALANLGAAYLRLGDYRRAIIALSKADALSEQTGQDRERIAILSSIGAALTFSGDPESAWEFLNDAVTLAKNADDGALHADALNNRGNYWAARAGAVRTPQAKEDRARALADYEQSAALASKAGDRSVEAKASVNAARLVTRTDRDGLADRMIGRASLVVAAMPDSAEKADLWIASGRMIQQLVETTAGHDAKRPARLRRAYDAYAQAHRLASGVGDERRRSFALGHMAQLYQSQGRSTEALELARFAVGAAQRAHVPEALYRWDWLVGRILWSQGRQDDAITAYRNATAALEGVRGDVALGYGDPGEVFNFREDVAPLFFELADLLTSRAAERGQPESGETQADLRAAREAVELLKAVELEDYFEEDCASEIREKQHKIDEVIAGDPHTAVVYLIPLPDRTELLVSSSRGTYRFRSDATAAEVDLQAREFRSALESRPLHSYRKPGARLYDWLIRPIRSHLQQAGIDTLVFVPDGALRTVPMAALYDRQEGEFLIEDYAVAITPGLALAAPGPLDRIRVLSSGIINPEEGSDFLPNVERELQKLEELFGATTLRDGQFTKSNLEVRLHSDAYTVVHIASHAEFAADVGETFILASGRRLSFADLQEVILPTQFRAEGRGIEILTLSACETAAGDDRAALGLAGVGVKAGARSAVATLWSVNDEASTDLMADFYEAIKGDARARLPRAKAMQQAQKNLLTHPTYRHAFYWSPFLVIGNWQ